MLTGADEVLLDELGAPREPKAPNTPECRIFRRAFSEITGDRFDPHFHRPKFEILATKLRRVPHVTMRELLLDSRRSSGIRKPFLKAHFRISKLVLSI